MLSEDKDQRFIFVADGANGQVSTLVARDRRDAQPVGPPRPPAGAVQVVHNIAIDGKGNLYTAEVGFGRRVQKFKRTN